MQNCMGCGKGFSVTVRKVRTARRMTSNKSSAMMDTFSLPSGSSTTADTVGTFSALNVRQGMPSPRIPKRQSGSARPASRSSKADSPLSFTSLNQTDSPLFPTPASRRRSVFVLFLMCTIADSPVCGSLALGGAFSEGGRRAIETWRECLYLFLCLCYSHGLLEKLKF